MERRGLQKIYPLVGLAVGVLGANWLGSEFGSAGQAILIAVIIGAALAGMIIVNLWNPDDR